MIKGCNDDQLRSKNINEKYFLFYQVWKELTAKKTLDTYQYRSMNTINSIFELVHVIEQRLNGNHNSNHNIQECKQETASIVKADEVLKNNYKVIYNRLLKCLHDTTDAENQLKVLRRQLIYYYNLIRQDYVIRLFEQLEKDIREDNQKEVIINAGKLVSNCAYEGWSDEALFGTIDILIDSSQNEDKWDLFKSRILARNKDFYKVIIPVKVRERKQSLNVVEQLKSYELTTKSGDKIKAEYSILEGIQDNVIYVDIATEAYDYYAASHIALAKYANVLNTLSFYSVIEPWTFNNIRWLVVNSKDNASIALSVKNIYSTYDYLDGAKKIYESSKKILTSVGSEAAGDIKSRLRASYSYANMGKASYMQEEKFINLWVALESLCRTDAYSNIISNVLEVVPPALCKRYIYRIIRNYYEDCKRCKIEMVFSTKTIRDNVSKEQIVEELIEIFNDKKLYNELYDKSKINRLLQYRTDKLKNLISCENEMDNAITKHFLNVRRQISRLYRLRNQIAHSAYNDDASLIRYIEHLEDYLSSFVAEVVMCAEENNETEMAMILEVVKENYNAYCEILNSKKSIDKEALLKSLRERGIIMLVPEKE